jgi:hypothetical protein
MLLFVFWVMAAHAMLFGTHSGYSVRSEPLPCRPSFVYYVSRHGIRYPGKGTVTGASALQGRSIRSKLGWLNSWRNPFDQVGALSRTGVHEVYDAGLRMKERIGRELREKETDIRSTQVSRTGRSAVAFMAALLPNEPVPSPYVSMSPKDADPLLRPFDVCPAFDVLAHRRVDELERLQASVLPSMASRIADVVGFSVNSSDVLLFWDICAFQVALFNLSSEFCSLFTEADHAQLNIIADVDTFYHWGYGNPMQGLGSWILQELLTLLTTNSGSFFFRFGHAESIFPLVVTLGLFKEKWHAAEIAPFQANVAVYVCLDQQTVILQVNERTVQQLSKTEFLQQIKRHIAVDPCPRDSTFAIVAIAAAIGALVAALLIGGGSMYMRSVRRRRQALVVELEEV